MTRTKITGIVLLVLLLGSVAVLVAAGAAGRAVAAGEDRIGVVYLDGPIQEAGGSVLAPGAITPALVHRRFGQVAADPRIRAVVLRVNSPGGTVAASQEIADLVAAQEVPVVVSMGDMAASGGYYLAASADHIVAQPGSLTGSIGVIWSTVDIDGLLETLGVDIDAVTAGEHKDMFLPGRLTPERRELVQGIVDLMYEDFVAAVAAGRDLTEDDARSLATGQVFTGAEALDLGLVDELGGLPEAVAAAERLAGVVDAAVVEFRPTFLEQLSAGPGIALRSLLEGAPLELLLVRDVIDGFNVPRYQ